MLNQQQSKVTEFGTDGLQENSQFTIPQASLMESFGLSAAELAQNGISGNDSNIGEIHSLY